jgi:hypothetical protein
MTNTAAIPLMKPGQAFQTTGTTSLGLTPKSEGPTYKGLYEGTYEHKNPRRNGRVRIAG